MRLDLSAFRYLSNDDFRVLTAIEMGMRNHEIVPVSLIETIAKIKRVNTNKVIANLLKFKLIEHSNLKYDGYSLNYIGYDYLSIHTLIKRGVLMRIGPKLGVGKESDVYICWVNPQAGVGTELSEEALKKLQNEMIVEFMKSNENENSDSDAEQNNNDGNSSDNQDDNSEEAESDSENEEDEEIVETNLAKHNENLQIKLNKKTQNKNFAEIIQEEKEAEKLLTQQLEQHYVENEENMRFDEELIINDIKCKIAVIKLARLGRTSFRAVKSKRDYVKNKSHYNWLYLSRVSATNEFKYLTGLYNAGFSVPTPYDHNRHAILMDYIPSYPLSRIDDLGDKEKAFNELVSTLVKLATKGLIHGDFNEFNILVHMKTQKIYFIDFPQMISLEHEDARKYFDRDIGCVNKFFYKKFGMKFDNNVVNFNDIVREDYMDITLKAYGFLNVMKRLRNENILSDMKERELKLENEERDEMDSDSAEEDIEEEDVEKIKEMKKNKKKLKKIEQNLLKNDKNILKENNFFDEDDLHFDKAELEKLGLNEHKQEDEKLNIKITKDEIREKVKKLLVKQINNTGVKGKSNRFKAKKKEAKIKE